MPVLKQIADDDPYTRIPNKTAQSTELSIEALGALTRLVSYSNNFEFKVEWLMASWKMGRDRIRNILRELRDAGYIKFQAKQADKGKFDGQEWYISTRPVFLADSTVLLKTRPTVNQEDNKKEENLKKPFSYENEANEAFTPHDKSETEDPSRAMWREGVRLLRLDGTSDRQCRTLLGKLIRDKGEEEVAKGIALASLKRPAEAKSYLVGILTKRTEPAQWSVDLSMLR